MSAPPPVRKRSVTLSSLDPSYSLGRRKDELRTSSINSLASGIAYFETGTRGRSCTWHGEQDAVQDSQHDGNNNPDIADLNDFEDNFESQELLRQIISEELDSVLRDCDYDSERSVKQGSVISQRVEGRVKSAVKSGTKIVSVVYIGEIRDQGIEITSQCLWDSKSDNFATASFRNKSLFAVCTVFTVQ
ncbi:dynein light chain Tctex-type 5 [Nematostella vectensis]|uniref:dynein light chain Tctex-type 5 n=1 Tax=Nematostella vectensis TaxID=45351 RepID=UPI00207774D3|nr:dynein light chain Tctex-type 5 [Nematostella vectensis]